MDTNYVGLLTSREIGYKSQMNMKRYFMDNVLRRLKPSTSDEFTPDHKAAVNSLDVDNTGRYLLSGGHNGSIYIHDLLCRTGDDSHWIPKVDGYTASHKKEHSVETVQWFPHNEGLFATSGAHGLRIWDANSMKPLEHYNFGTQVYHHQMSPIHTSPVIAVASGSSSVRLVDLRTGQSAHQLLGHSGSVICCAWSPTEEHLLATGSSDSRILLWDTRSSKKPVGALDCHNKSCKMTERKAHKGMVTGLSFAPHGSLLMSIGTDLALRGWAVGTQKLSRVHYGKYPAKRSKHVSLTVDGYSNYNVCFLAADSTVFVLRMETGETLSRLPGHYVLVNCCYFQRERMELYTAGQDGNIIFWTKPVGDQDSSDDHQESFWVDSGSESEVDDT